MIDRATKLEAALVVKAVPRVQPELLLAAYVAGVLIGPP